MTAPTGSKHISPIEEAKEAVNSLDPFQHSSERYREVWQELRRTYEDAVDYSDNTNQTFPLWALSQFDNKHLERILTKGYYQSLGMLNIWAPSASRILKVKPWRFILFFHYIEQARARAINMILKTRPGLTFNQLYEEVQQNRLKRIKSQDNPKKEFLPRDFRNCFIVERSDDEYGSGIGFTDKSAASWEIEIENEEDNSGYENSLLIDSDGLEDHGRNALPIISTSQNGPTKTEGSYIDKTATKITKETQADIIAPPPTDSAYGSASKTENKLETPMHHAGIEQLIQEVADQNISDVATDYSDESTTNFSKKQGYVWWLANELFEATSPSNADKITLARVSNILPELLQAFALKVGYGAKTHMHRHVMAFVHRYRREIATEFSDIIFKKDLDDSSQKMRRAEEMSWKERTSRWFGNTSFEESPEEPGQPTAGDSKTPEENFPDEDEEVLESWLNVSRNFLTSSSAYEELLAQLRREFYLLPAELNIIGDIRGRIISSLPSPRKVSRRISPSSCHAIFQLDWDIIDFFNTQGYLKEPYEVFEGVITITGSLQDAQAATCAQYIKQTWPFIGEIVILLVKDALKGANHVCQLPDGTAITAWIDTPKFMLEVYGISVSIAEIGELFSWLGAALRTSPRHNGLTYCVPNIRNIDSNSTLLTHIMTPPSSTLVMYEIDFAMDIAPQSLPAANGQCWHNIFRNPVVVRGYPIPQKLERNTGLEISLNMMAGLARTQWLNRIKEKLYIKGFSTMLVPTKKNTDTICWHLIYKKDGGHVSYLDDYTDQEQHIGHFDLENYRHVLGWCSEAKLYAGSVRAHHSVSNSELPAPHAGCALAGMRVQGRKMFLNDSEYHIGAKDTPECIVKEDDVVRLDWISTKFVLLWDERDKRGWLINGTTALLYIVRTYLSHAKEKFDFIFNIKDEDIQEAEPPFTAESAMKVLLNYHNRRLKIYKVDDDDGDKFLLKTRIEYFYNRLELLIECQAVVARDCGSKLSSIPRRYLEGWDFEAVAEELPDLDPLVATIATAGKGWIDFVRAIHAVTLVGQGFGDIIKPAGQGRCDYWATLPTKRYYIASCVSDLKRLMKMVKKKQEGYVLLCDDLICHTPASVHMPCQCRLTPGEGQCEPVRTIIPRAMSNDSPIPRHLIQFEALEAVILGYNSHFPLIWGDTGPPQQGRLLETEPPFKAIETNVDSGFGSNSTESELESHSVSQSKSETQYSARPEELHRETANKVVMNLTIPIDNNEYTRSQYTVGIICPLAKELKAVWALFDNRHHSLSPRSEDGYPYILGDMAGHWVVAACLPECGTNSAATVASNMKFNFSSIRFCFLVGIAGGVPSKEKDIRLGDVVVSYPTGTSPGVVQYDLGKEEDSNHFRRTGSLQRPPLILMAAINTLQSDPTPPDSHLDEILGLITYRLPEYKHPGESLDILYEAASESCASHDTCFESCSHIRQRVPRTTTTPKIHYGLIASGNRVIKNRIVRNQVAQEHGILCFEMEAAGVMNTVDCLVIRGISDYCDAQKNDTWQEYAAATAAAYAKLLLEFVPKTKRPGAGSTERNGDMTLTKKRKLDQ